MRLPSSVRRIARAGTNLTGLRVTTVILPAVFVVLLELARYRFVGEGPPTLASISVLFAVVLVASFLFSRFIFCCINYLQGERIRELETLAEVNQAVEEFRDLNALLNHAMDKLIDVTDADLVELYLVDERSRELVHTSYGSSPDDAPIWQTQPQRKRRLMEESARFSRPAVVETLEDLHKEAAPGICSVEVGSLAMIPLKARSDTVGVVCLLSLEPDHFRRDQTDLLFSIGHSIAVAIENARLHEKAQAVAVLEERERISAELHDGLAQILGYVITKSQATRQLLRKLTVATDYLAEIENVAQGVYKDTRDAILGLSTAISDDRNLVSALQEYATQFTQMHGLRTEFIVGDRLIPSLPPSVELQAFRIVQEALSNVRKHAEATLVQVRVSAGDNEVTIVVEDDGSGFDADEIERRGRTSFGLRNMKGRAAGINGRLCVESRPEEGTKVTLSIPLAFLPVAVETEERVENTDS